MAGNRTAAVRRQAAAAAYHAGARDRQMTARSGRAVSGDRLHRPAQQQTARLQGRRNTVSDSRREELRRQTSQTRREASRRQSPEPRRSGARPPQRQRNGTAAGVRTMAGAPRTSGRVRTGTPARTVAAGSARTDRGYSAAARQQTAGAAVRGGSSSQAAGARTAQSRSGGGQTAEKKKKNRRFYDYSLLFCIVFLTVFGLVMIYSASSYTAQLTRTDGNGAFFMQRQAMVAAMGFAGMLLISKIDYHRFARFAWPAYIVSYILMIAVHFVGIEVNGKRRWLGVSGASFQPTELVKIALILLLAVVINDYGNRINQWKSMRRVIILTLPIAGLVAANNLSSGIIICGIAFVMLFVACRIKWPFFGLCGIGIGTLACAGPIGTLLLQLHLLQPYQYRRIEAWLNPELDPGGKGFQTLQGLYAIGSGGLVGQGLGESIQKLGFLPESQNDMIFAIICEELGLFGAVSIILIFLFLIYRCMVIANSAPDLLGSLMVVGVMGHIAIQVILNIAVVTNTIPNTGITLPFISYGGTSVLFLLTEMGIVLSVANRIRLET